MSARKSPSPEPESTPSLQKIAIAAGTFVVVTLTVVAALFLAMQDMPRGPETPVIIGQASPTAAPPTPISAPVTPPPSPSPSPSPIPQPATPTTTQPPAADTATATATPLPPTETPTLLPPPSTPVVIVVTATPVTAPATLPPAAPAGGVCQPPAGWVAYIVQQGDTLNLLAERTGASINELQKFNCLPSFTLQLGQQIFLPIIPPSPTPTSIPSPTARPGSTATRTATPASPQIDSVTPSRVDRAAADVEVIITVLGRNFQPEASGFRIDLRGPASVPLTLANRGSSTSFDAIVPAGLPLGTYSIIVTNPDDRAGIRQSAYVIGPSSPTDTPSPAPDVIRFTPTSGKINEEITLTVQGVNFEANQPGFKVELQAISGSFKLDLELGSTRTDTTFTAIIRANTLERGDYNLVVTNTDGRSDIASERYRTVE